MSSTHKLLWHARSASEVMNELATHVEHGLSENDAKQRLAKYGPNVLERRRDPSALVRFLLQFHQPLVYILLVACLVTVALGEYADAAVIFIVVLANAIIGYIQEAKALTAIEALARTLQTSATVLRDGRRSRIPAAELVPGDLVFLQSGDQVPADLRLVTQRDLRIAEAALTGESVPSEKQVDNLSAETPLADRGNMAYASTLVTYGSGVGVVVATGSATEVGRISQLLETADNLSTPLTRRIAQFSKTLLMIILALAAGNFLVGYLRQQPLAETFLASVALAVAAIPEGLPAAVTIVLAIGVSRMAARRAVIRKLPAVETLGSTTVICSDKTGTLTQNQMTVTAIVAGGEHFQVTGTGYNPSGELLQDGTTAIKPELLKQHVALWECLHAGLLCNDASLKEVNQFWAIQGDPTEGALVVVAAKAGLLQQDLNRLKPRIDAIPFESEYQYMATLHAQDSGSGKVLYAKGSVEAILQRCDRAINAQGQPEPLHPEAIHATVAKLAGEGLRVLAFARKIVPDQTSAVGHEDMNSLEFLGLQAMIDPPRPEAIQAVAACQTAGVRVKMITGDHAMTAQAIAGQLGLITSSTTHRPVVTGKELQEVSDADLPQLADDVAVFARVAPEQKLRLVKALQQNGHIVAMTGDGVNDAPALRQANIGIAMGLGGTDVAREAADMVLTDDNFATIEAAVEEGRGVFDNLTKFIVWTLPTNIGEGLVILLAVILGSSLPISPIQILWINLVTAVGLGLMLAFEPKEANLMQRQPRDPSSSLLSLPLLKRVGFVSLQLLAGAFGLFHWMLWSGHSVDEARTVAVNVFVIGELFYLFNCRSLTQSIVKLGLLSNPAALFGAFGVILLQLALTYIPFMNTIFKTAPIAAYTWIPIVLFGIILYMLVELEKRLVGYVLLGEQYKSRPPAKTHHE